MICRIETEAERRATRLKFYKDDVFVIAHKAMKDMSCSLSLEEIFCSAEKLTHRLLTHEIVEDDFMDYEMDDFENSYEDKDALFLILTVAFIKLCALRKVNPLAKDVAKALVHRCQKYEGFTELLGKLDKVEQKRMVDKGRIDLLSYELKTIEKEKPNLDTINELVNSTLECSVKVIENAIVAFSNFNNEQNHRFDMQLNVLTQGYKDKLNGKDVKKIIIEKAEFKDATFGSMYDVHDNENVHTR